MSLAKRFEHTTSQASAAKYRTNELPSGKGGTKTGRNRIEVLAQKIEVCKAYGVLSLCSPRICIPYSVSVTAVRLKSIPTDSVGVLF